jgi:hypothetical protein
MSHRLKYTALPLLLLLMSPAYALGDPSVIWIASIEIGSILAVLLYVISLRLKFTAKVIALLPLAFSLTGLVVFANIPGYHEIRGWIGLGSLLCTALSIAVTLGAVRHSKERPNESHRKDG